MRTKTKKRRKKVREKAMKKKKPKALKRSITLMKRPSQSTQTPQNRAKSLNLASLPKTRQKAGTKRTRNLTRKRKAPRKQSPSPSQG